MSRDERIPIGIWSQLGAGSRWANEGVARVIGFLIEGAAKGGKYSFHLVVQRGLAEDVREDFRTLDAVEGRDWLVWEPTEEQERNWDVSRASEAGLFGPTLPIAGLADFANKHMPVEGWVISFPHFTGSVLLDKPKALLYPDALPYDFHLAFPGDENWEDVGQWPTWRKLGAVTAKAADTIITFSEHVGRRHLIPLAGVAWEKVRVVPLAPPDLSPNLPFVQDHRQTPDSRTRAADILRAHMQERGLDYLRDFPFEEVEFVAAATQDRATKNLGLTAEAVRRIVREQRHSMKYLLTAPIHRGADWTRLPRVYEGHQFHLDILSIPDLPREVHAALFHCATMIVHSSFFEGIIGALPFYEGASVGTPVLLADGPHVQELLQHEPDMKPFVYDPYDTDGLARSIRHVAGNRDAVVAAQRTIYDRLKQRNWADVAHDYASAALEGAKGRRGTTTKARDRAKRTRK